MCDKLNTVRSLKKLNCGDKEYFLLLSLTETVCIPIWFPFMWSSGFVLFCFLPGTSVTFFSLSQKLHIFAFQNVKVRWIKTSSIKTDFSLDPPFGACFHWMPCLLTPLDPSISFMSQLPFLYLFLGSSGSPMYTAVSESQNARLYINEPNQSHLHAYKREYCFASFSSFCGHLMFLYRSMEVGFPFLNVWGKYIKSVI